MEYQLENIKSRLISVFNTERNFLIGIPDSDYKNSQFRYFFHLLQNLYFNGNDISQLNKLFYPIRFKQHKATGALINQLARIRKTVDPNYKEETSIEDFLISNYLYLETLIDKDVSEQPKSIEKKVILSDYISNDESYFKHFIELVKYFNNSKLKSYNNIIISNSIVTMDYCKGFSDLDIMINLNADAFKHPKNLRQLRKEITKGSLYLYKHDPTQHHGFFIFNKAEMEQYPEAIYPTILHKYSSVIKGNHQLTYRFTNDKLEKRVFLYRSLNKLISFLEKPSSSFNLFTLKDFVSQVTLFPALYIQSKGDYIYKRDSFQQLDKYFVNTSCFKLSEEIRNEFPYNRIEFWPTFMHPTILPSYYGKKQKSNLVAKVEELKSKVFLLISEITDQLNND